MYTNNNLDNKKYYSTIRENLINNFFKRNYLSSVVTMKERVIEDMRFRCPFEIQKVDNDYKCINVVLEKEDYLMISLKWEERNNGKTKTYKLMKIE